MNRGAPGVDPGGKNGPKDYPRSIIVEHKYCGLTDEGEKEGEGEPSSFGPPTENISARGPGGRPSWRPCA